MDPMLYKSWRNLEKFTKCLFCRQKFWFRHARLSSNKKFLQLGNVARALKYPAECTDSGRNSFDIFVINMPPAIQQSATPRCFLEKGWWCVRPATQLQSLKFLLESRSLCNQSSRLDDWYNGISRGKKTCSRPRMSSKDDQPVKYLSRRQVLRLSKENRDILILSH